MHSLLRRQLKKYQLDGEGAGLPAEFLRAVEAAYAQYDDDRRMLERSLELSSRELLHANADTRALLESLPDLFLRLDGRGRILDCRGAAVMRFFPGAPAVVGATFEDLVQDPARGPLRAALDEATRTRASGTVEYRLTHADGDRYFEARIMPSVEGQVIAIVRDITAVHQAALASERHTAQLLRQQAALQDLASAEGSDPEEALGRACTVVATTLGVARASVWFYNEENDAIACAWLWCDGVLTREPGTLLARASYPRYFRALESSLTIAAEDAREDARTSEFTEGYLVPLGITSMLDCAIRVDGHSVGVLCLEHVGPARAWSLEDQDFAAAVASFVALSRSIAQRRDLESQLRHAQKLEAVGVLAGGVAHDFNNLLTAILGFSELVRAAATDDTMRSHIGEVISAGHRASELTSRLLAFGRKQARHPRLVDLNALVSGSARLLGRVIGEAIDFRVEAAPGTLHIVADPHQVEQVLMNLVVNARDAMRDRGGTIRLATGRHEVLPHSVASRVGNLAAGRYVTLTVEDTGIGMPPDVVNRVFEPFFTTKPVGQGTGLGLSMVYGIVQQSGGHIEVESVPGRGTTFRVLLPEADAPIEEPRAVQTSEGTLPGGTETILLVEDEAIVRLLAVQLLQRLGYRVLVASRPSEALRLARETDEAIDILVSDLVMPEMNGRELYRELSALLPELRVLYMSGYAPSTVLRDAPGVPALSYLQKPFTFRELADRVREQLDAPAAVESAPAS